jgi:hypothetical protein
MEVYIMKTLNINKNTVNIKTRTPNIALNRLSKKVTNLQWVVKVRIHRIMTVPRIA